MEKLLKIFIFKFIINEIMEKIKELVSNFNSVNNNFSTHVDYYKVHKLRQFYYRLQQLKLNNFENVHN